ncbi:MAG: long-chain fatty acid--CoA ligase, partial [Gammaproteobacteria bacterium]|nr:long-chain fatty acid--CoA ligase [Gammaproteobacteria bacterium]
MVDMMIEQLAGVGANISSLRKISYGGAPMTEAALRRAIAALPHTRFYQVYGQTEGGPNISVLGPEYHVIEGARAGKLRSAGKPLPGTELAILDSEDRPLPQGQTGEIGVRGVSVSPGYWTLPEVTEEANRGGWLHTGDVGY